MWYVYFYKDPRDNSIFYVGKGKHNRCKVHLYRASTWMKKGKPANQSSLNLHLMRKILQIRDAGYEPNVEIIEYFNDENEAYEREMREISLRVSSLCNLTEGGEGYRVSKEKRQKIGLRHRQWMQSDEGLAWRKKISESYSGSGNPNFGKKEDEEHKKIRMKNFLEKERWNKGLKGDPRSKGAAKGSIPANAKTCYAVNVDSGEIVFAESKLLLLKKMKESGIKMSLSSISRSIVENIPKLGWIFTYERPSEQG